MSERHLEPVPEPPHLELVRGPLYRDEVDPIPKPEPRYKPRRGLAKISRKRRAAERALEAAKAEARLRSGGRCEAWAWAHACTLIATEYHHRLPRSRGGEHSVANLVHVCQRAHQAIHDYPESARKAGLLA